MLISLVMVLSPALVPSPMPMDRRAALVTAALTTATLHASPAFAGVPALTLSDGTLMPQLALNTAGLSADESERAVRLAASLGVTHIDFHPGIERDGVARVLTTSNQPKLFLTTKIRKAKRLALGGGTK